MADHPYSAAEAVLSIPELLENILLQDVDMNTLLQAQNVNTMFRSTIRHSIHLKRILWLAPLKDSRRPSDGSLELNPFFSRGGKKKTLFGGGIQMRRDPRSGERTAYAICGKTELLALARDQEQHRGSLEGSWRSMAIVRPADESFLLDLCCYDGNGWASLEVECGKGATAGRVLDTAAGLIKDVQFGRFGDVVCAIDMKT